MIFKIVPTGSEGSLVVTVFRFRGAWLPVLVVMS